MRLFARGNWRNASLLKLLGGVLLLTGLTGEVQGRVRPLPVFGLDESAVKDPLREMALAGDVPSQLRLAEEFFFGKDRPANPALAVYWWRKAAEAGSGDAHYNLGMALNYGWGVEQNPALGRKELQAAAQAGIALAELRLAEQEYKGYPEMRTDAALYPALTADPEGALKKIRALAAKGMIPAHRVLAQLLDGALDRMKYQTEIRQSLRLVAESPEAAPEDLLRYSECLRRGSGGVPDMTAAYRFVKRAADAGYPAAKVRLGGYLLRGEGVKEDRAAGIKLIREGADAGLPEAQCELAELYLFSPEFPCDPWKAFELFSAAARQNYPHGQKRLGDCYQKGIGVETDLRSAFWEYDKAARQGDSDAELELGLCYKNGTGIGADPAGAFFWFRRSAGRGNVGAIREMGIALMEGRGTTRSTISGEPMLRYAASQGDTEAITCIQQKNL